MSLIQCEIHGLQGGPHCCKHVSSAIYKRSEDIEYAELVYEIDKEHGHVIQHLICIDCLKTYNLEKNMFITEDVWESEDRFPYVCPTCIECVKEYEKSSKT